MAVGAVAIHCVSFVLMGIGVAVLVFEGLVYNVVFLGRILPALGKSIYAAPFAVVFNLVWIPAVWSYLQAYWTNPGSVPTKWHEFVQEVRDELVVVSAKPAWQPGLVTYCPKCPDPRPERAKHCKICDICILRMDHHCPWINNCVGFKNHKFFLLLLIYAGLASVIAVGTSFPELMRCSAMFAHMEGGTSFAWGLEHVSLGVSDITIFLLFGVVALFAVVLFMSLLSQHLPLAMRNITSIEKNYENMPNPFEQGGISANLAQIFGALGPDWFFPIPPRRPLTDGISFERCNDPFKSCTSSFQPEQVWRDRFNVHSFTPVLEENELDILDLATKKCANQLSVYAAGLLDQRWCLLRCCAESSTG